MAQNFCKNHDFGCGLKRKNHSNFYVGFCARNVLLILQTLNFGIICLDLWVFWCQSSCHSSCSWMNCLCSWFWVTFCPCNTMPRWFNSNCFTAELEPTSMAVLELSHCSLTSVPSDIFKSKEGKLLEEVYLDANQLRDLPRVSLEALIYKERINVNFKWCYRAFVDLFCCCMILLAYMFFFFFSDCNLLLCLSLQALFSLQNLQVLSLSDNELTIIPSAISNLVNLRQVNFSKNGECVMHKYRVFYYFFYDRCVTPYNVIISHKQGFILPQE